MLRKVITEGRFLEKARTVEKIQGHRREFPNLGAMKNTLYPTPTTAEIAARIRTIRKSKKLTLDAVAERSNGQLKSVVLGSYERGTRAISLARAIQIANALDVPLTHLFSDLPPKSSPVSHPISLDLRALREKAKSGAVTHEEKKYLPALLDFASWIAHKRSDWNGEVLSIRKNDLETIALMGHTEEDEVVMWLKKAGLALER